MREYDCCDWDWAPQLTGWKGKCLLESPEITRLLEALRPEKDADAFPIARRKHAAEIALDRILDAIGREQWPLGAWEAY